MVLIIAMSVNRKKVENLFYDSLKMSSTGNVDRLIAKLLGF